MLKVPYAYFHVGFFWLDVELSFSVCGLFTIYMGKPRVVHSLLSSFVSKQNSELLNFVPELLLPLLFVQSVPVTEKLLGRLENGGIKDGLKKCLEAEWNQEQIWNIPFRETALPFQMFLCSRKFSVETFKKVVCHLISNQIFCKVFEWWTTEVNSTVGLFFGTNFDPSR